MRYLGRGLAAAGYSVLAPRLPGHGTTPEEMFHTRWRDWYGACEKALNLLRKECDRVYALGLSMGGVLALHLAAHEPLAGVVSMGAPFVLKDPKLLLVPIARRFPISLIYRYDREIGRDVKDPEMRAQMICYPKTPVPCVVSLLELLTHVRHDLPEVRVPTMVVHAKEDHLVPFENAMLIYDEVRAPVRRLLVLENSYHVVTIDFDRQTLLNEILRFIMHVETP